MRYIAYLLSTLSLAFLSTSMVAQSDCIRIIPETDSLIVCADATVTLTAEGALEYSWSPAADFDDPTASTVVLSPSSSQWYVVTGMIGDSTCYDSVYVTLNTNVNTFEVSISTTDTICPLDTVFVTFAANNPIDSVLWATTEGVVDIGSITGTAITPLDTNEYIVTAFLQGCEVSDTFSMNVIDFRFRLLSEDTIYLCLGDTGRIGHNMFPTNLDVVWQPLDSTITLETMTQASVYPTISATYTATTSYEDCVLSTTTYVRVDSLPDTLLTVIPFKDPYCAGEMFTIFSERADTLKYPDIEFQWYIEGNGSIDSFTSGNVLATIIDTTTYFRVIRQNACIDTSRIMLNAIPPGVPLSVTDTTLCPGDMFQVEVLDPQIMDIEWEPTEGLSCSDCPNPIVTVEIPQQYTISGVVEGDGEDCPVTGSLDVNIWPPYPIPVSPPFAEACPGDMIQFSIDTTGLTNLNVSVSGGSVSCNNCPDPVVTYTGDTIILFITADELFEDYCGALSDIVIGPKPPEVGPEETRFVCNGETTEIPLGQLGLVNPEVFLNGTFLCNCENPEVTVTSNSTLTILSESQDPNHCVREDMINIEVYEPDEFSFDLGSEPPYGQGEVVTVTLLTDPMASLFEWTVNGLPLTGNTSSINAPLNEESNTILVEWINSNGCVQVADTTIETVPPYYRIPKAFTPNRSANSTFRIEIVGNLVIEEMLVFNRWGQVVYDGNSDDGWDGSREGKPAPAEVYAYLIKLREPNGNTILEKGDVTLIR